MAAGRWRRLGGGNEVHHLDLDRDDIVALSEEGSGSVIVMTRSGSVRFDGCSPESSPLLSATA